MPITPYLNQYISKKLTRAYDVYGVAQSAIPQNILCRIQSSHKRIMSPQGVEFAVEAEIWVNGTEVLAVDDIVVWDGVEYKIVTMEIKKGLTGTTNHKKGYLVRNKEE